jgi:transketolase
MNINKITNRQVICQALLEEAQEDKDILVVCSDSRGSGSMGDFFEEFPEQSLEVGIAEQNLVTVSSGLASCGKKPYAVSPACFLSTRSYEQIKIDVAYSKVNVKLIGISGGISYGALGMSHHSLQDIAALSALPDMRIFLPCDRFETKALMSYLYKDALPAYIRVSRNASRDIYDEKTAFDFPKAKILKRGNDILLVACGEMVGPALDAALILEKAGLKAGVMDLCSLKPLDAVSLIAEARNCKIVASVEEHSPFGGLGSQVAQVISYSCPRKVIEFSLPDGHIIPGTSEEAFKYYGLTGEGIAARLLKEIRV